MEEKINSRVGIFAVLLVAFVLSASLIYAQNVQPTPPSSMTYVQNFSDTNQTGYVLNHSRSFIYEYTFDEAQQTPRWKAYVGNVTGSFGLIDASSNYLYKWPMTDVSGEVYATHFNPTSERSPVWTNVTCATPSNRTAEEVWFNHNSVDEDSYSSTWLNGSTAAFNHSAITVGETAVSANSCYGVNLYTNNAHDVTNWVEVLLQDGECSGTISGYCNVIYTAIIQDDTTGFNNNVYDYQLLLPEENQNGTPANTAYWFYIELV